VIEIIKAGPVTTIQDLGRQGFRHQGIAQSGALDRLSLMIANRLVCNPDNAAGLEMMYGRTSIRFETKVCFALTGCECFATLDGSPIYIGWRCYANAGQILTIQTPVRGLCAYLAVHGGLDVDPIMGSRATDLQAGFGGIAGRKLRPGDRIPLGMQQAIPQVQIGVLLPQCDQTLRVLPGPEAEQYSADTHLEFFSAYWQIGQESGRMGLRLAGKVMRQSETSELLSHGVFPGVIQVPPGGQPIILAAEAQTTGGYPRIAIVIESDLWKLGQLKPGDMIRFESVSFDEAKQAQQKQDQYINRISYALKLRDLTC
jgi:biotin-dependent carboxylase-like uncharacterized protein